MQHYAPRTVAFLAELVHPPVHPDPAPVQRLHNEMFQGGEPAYRSFNVAHNGSVLSNPPVRAGAASAVSVLADRIQFREEFTGLTVDEFAGRAVDVTGKLAQARGIQLFTAVVITIRTLINPRSFRDSREFLRQGMFGFSSEMEAFGRQPHLYGMRLVFPPSREEPQAFTLRIESFANDQRSIFIENQGSFQPLVMAKGIETLRDHIELTYSFIIERALRFLSNFDVARES